MLHNVAEDEQLDGRSVTVHGRTLLNFGSCSYLGLEMHPALKAGVVDALARFGTQFSSSRAYASSPAYREGEEVLARLFGRPAVITPSTTMGHVAAMPTLIGSRDALLLDHQVHHSVQTAAKLVQAQGSTVRLIRHSDLDALEAALVELRSSHRRVWYACDGLYSMYADFAPTAGLDRLAARHENLWLYVDDAHSVSWTGRHGRGRALEHLAPDTLRRTVVAASLNKSFAAAGGAILPPDEESARRIFMLGGPLIFSGPVQPPMLGAVLASARLHLSAELPALQERLLERIRLFNALAAEYDLPLVSSSEAPIRCVGAGNPRVAYRLTEFLRTAGYFVSTAVFPAVSAKRCGARITLTGHHSEEDVRGLVAALADGLPAALSAEGSSVGELEQAFSAQLGGRSVLRRQATPRLPGPRRSSDGLRLEHHSTVADVDRAEWDRMFGARGSFDWQGLRALEAAFGTQRDDEPEHSWEFHYWLVRDDAAGGRVVAATHFTTALWKDDMLSSAEISAEVERRRQATGDPRYLTSTMVAMGSLLTEGDHLYLDRRADWRTGLHLILQAARQEEDRTDAAAVVLRDLPDGDPELHEVLLGEGFLRVPVWDTWVREIDFVDDEAFLAQLTRKQRQHKRTQVLPWEPRYRIEVLAGGDPASRQLTAAELDHLHGLYQNVHARGLELNVFPLPRRLLDTILRSPGWELVLLHLVDGPAEPVAFTAVHVGREHVAPMFAGLDYDYVASHRAYQQLLWQAVRSAQRHDARRVLYGMAAGLHKRRFGAVPEKRWVYVQPTDNYHVDVLAQIAETVAAAAAR